MTIDLSRYTVAQLLEMEAIAVELKRRESRRAIDRMYPDDGPLRRELYAKHMAFFKAGSVHRERLFMAANRVGKCCTYKTLIETASGPKTIGSLYERGRPFRVWAWKDATRVKAWALPPFRKPGVHHCYRLTMADGRWAECADHHRILCVDGWRRISELLPQSSLFHSRSIAERDRSVHDADVQSCSQKASGFQSHYSEGFRLCDELLLSARENGQAYAPSLADVGLRIPVLSGVDGLGREHTNICQLNAFHLASPVDVLRRAVRSAVFSGKTACTTSEQLSGSLRGGGQPHPVSTDQPRSAFELPPHAGQTSACGLPWASSVILAGGAPIIGCEYIGRHEVYDFTVPECGNYLAGGLVHHNSYGAGGYETALHLSGQYPHWWEGRRFDRPIRAWVAGKTNTTTRDIIQTILLGSIEVEGGRKGFSGTGLIKGDLIGPHTWKQGVADLADTVRVKHSSGGWSVLGFKSYEQGRGSFEGVEQELIWMDEEPDMAVYVEALIRTMTTGGIVMITFTPLEGWSEVVTSFLTDGNAVTQ